ncbi:MAG: hypothetical protein DI551_11470 [Micavibrio aeruginosavorus]|uniref:Uncharacterized protein n=1 Tax=Micavibrio aeruginosavorus TaxID=349221 RepID=A0A2W5MUC6_9BACT|nr:MAG: hypothetical protein DI551_11470 [Micavibrio aeruginosavorus]
MSYQFSNIITLDGQPHTTFVPVGHHFEKAVNVSALDLWLGTNPVLQAIPADQKDVAQKAIIRAFDAGDLNL